MTGTLQFDSRQTVDEISDDTTLADGETTALVTEKRNQNSCQWDPGINIRNRIRINHGFYQIQKTHLKNTVSEHWENLSLRSMSMMTKWMIELDGPPLQYFAEFHMDGVERLYLKHQITALKRQEQ